MEYNKLWFILALGIRRYTAKQNKTRIVTLNQDKGIIIEKTLNRDAYMTVSSALQSKTVHECI